MLVTLALQEQAGIASIVLSESVTLGDESYEF